PADPDSAAIRQYLAAHADAFLTVLAHDGHIGNVDGRFTLHDAALDILLGVRPRVALDHLNALDDNPLLVWNNNQDATRLAAILTAQYGHFVVLLDRIYRWH